MVLWSTITVAQFCQEKSEIVKKKA